MIASDHVVGPGAHSLEFAYAPDGDGGTAVLGVDGRGGAGRDPAIHADELQRDGAGLSCGYEVGPAVGDDYEAPFRFTGMLPRDGDGGGRRRRSRRSGRSLRPDHGRAVTWRESSSRRPGTRATSCRSCRSRELTARGHHVDFVVRSGTTTSSPTDPSRCTRSAWSSPASCSGSTATSGTGTVPGSASARCVG